MAALRRQQVRGARLVSNVLRVTLAEIGRAGLEHLSIEKVAELAGVNKTTIYRRWPTPQDLAHAALQCAAGTDDEPPDTGSLRGDLRAFAREFRSIAMLPEMKTIMRLRWSGTPRGPIATSTRDIQKKKHAQWKAMLRRALSRGELRKGTNIDLLQDVLLGTLIYLVVLGPRPSDLARLDHAMDIVLEGVLHGPRPRGPR
jgi:AcrR family transcriptional regulator